MDEGTVAAMKLHRVVLLLILSFFWMFSEAQAQQLPPTSQPSITAPSNCSITGRVLYGDNLRGAEGILITLKQSGLPRDRTYTRSEGQYEFVGLPPTIYTVIVEAEGYRPVEELVDLSFSCQRSGVMVTLESELKVQQTTTQAAVSARDLQIPNKARKEFEKGVKELHQKQNAKKSLAYFTRAIELYGDYDEAYVQLAVAHSQLGDNGKAEEVLRQALAHYSDNFRAHAFLGMLLNHQDKLEEGIAELQAAVKGGDDNWLTHYELGKALIRNKRGAEALPHAQRAHELNPKESRVHLLLHDAYILQDDIEDALAEVEEYIKLFPEDKLVPRLQNHAAELRQSLAAKTE